MKSAPLHGPLQLDPLSPTSSELDSGVLKLDRAPALLGHHYRTDLRQQRRTNPLTLPASAVPQTNLCLQDRSNLVNRPRTYPIGALATLPHGGKMLLCAQLHNYGSILLVHLISTHYQSF